MVGVVHQAAEDGVGQSRITDQLVPVVHRQLAGDDGRARVIAVVQQLGRVAALFRGERDQSPRTSRSVLA